MPGGVNGAGGVPGGGMGGFPGGGVGGMQVSSDVGWEPLLQAFQ